MARLVSEERRHLVGTLLPRREPFQVLYRLNCDNLCSDFQVGLISAILVYESGYRAHCLAVLKIFYVFRMKLANQ